MPVVSPTCNASLIITAWKEPKTVAKALTLYAEGSVVPQEVLVICPDQETKEAALAYTDKFPALHVHTDPGQGKVHALAIGRREATTPFLIYTDGDVIPDHNTVKHLVETLTNSPYTAVTGHPKSLEPRSTLFGYWSHFLVDAAHAVRSRRSVAKQHLTLSGYLFIIKAEAMPDIPAEILSDDAYISAVLDHAGQHIGYAPHAYIYVKYPTHYQDWLLQKRRSAGGFTQLKSYIEPRNQMRSLSKEIIYGLQPLCTYPTSLREFFWTVLLTLARLHLWTLITIDRYSGKHRTANLWKRVESTKE